MVNVKDLLLKARREAKLTYIASIIGGTVLVLSFLNLILLPNDAGSRNKVSTHSSSKYNASSQTTMHQLETPVNKLEEKVPMDLATATENVKESVSEASLSGDDATIKKSENHNNVKIHEFEEGKSGKENVQSAAHNTQMDDRQEESHYNTEQVDRSKPDKENSTLSPENPVKESLSRDDLRSLYPNFDQGEQGYRFVGAQTKPTVTRFTAVCVSGYRASHIISDRLAKSFIQNILEPANADLFVYIAQDDVRANFDIDKFFRLFHPWLRGFMIINEKNLNNEHEYWNNYQGKNTKFALPDRDMRYFMKLQKCYHLLVAPLEAIWGNYDHIIQTRPDVFYTSVINVSTYNEPFTLWTTKGINGPDLKEGSGLADWAWAGPGDRIGFNDQFWITSSFVMRIVSNALFELLASGPRMDREWFFPESSLYFVTVLTHKISVMRCEISYELHREVAS